MITTGSLGVTTYATPSDEEVVVTRVVDAPRRIVFDAWTDPRHVPRWQTGPDGWTMPVCISEARSGGKIRYEWSNGKGGEFYVTGEYVELEPFSRLVHIERMHMPDPTPDNHIVTTFTPDGAGTLMMMRMTLPDSATRAMMLASGMEGGMEASYVRLQNFTDSSEFV